MRTSILCAAFLGLFAAGCAGELSGTGEGDDTTGGPDCGNGTTDSGETCDDGNTLSGDGCSATCTMEVTTTPRVGIAVDKSTLTTDLLVNNEINVTLTSVNGFTGDVTLTATVVDGTQAAITGWTTTLSKTTVTLAAEATDTAKMTLRIPGDSTPLAGSVKITATSTAGSADAAIAVTANPVATITYLTTGNTCVYPADFALSTTPIRLKVNRMLRVVNGTDPTTTGCGGTACRMQIHFDAGTTGINHQGSPMNAGSTYDQTPTAANATGVTFYCHNANLTDTAVEASATGTRQRLITVP
jgi:cysteine-rich repeat protein